MKYGSGLMNKFCLICTPRSGSFYVQKYLSQTFSLEFGSEWFGRVKHVHYEGMKTSPVDIDHSVNEDLLDNEDITKRQIYLMNYNKPFIIKCMPFQLTNTQERVIMSLDEKMFVAKKMLSHYSLIYLHNEDKISQFCFDVISKNQDHVKRNYTSYNPEVRETPPDNSMTATKEHFDSFKWRQDFVDEFQNQNWKGEPIIEFEKFVLNRNTQTKKVQDWYGLKGIYGDRSLGFRRPIIPHADYKKIFTNYGEIEKWFG